jgi:two-component system, chemotaxis family, response regulator Rcp1
MSELAVGRPMEILLVEDSLIDARITMEALQQSGVKHRLTLIRDGDECLQFLTQQGMFAKAPRPDLVLLDLNLPKRDGFELLDCINDDDRLKQKPVVVLTSEDGSDVRERCEDLHVQSFIHKPVNIEKFLDTIQILRRDWLKGVILPEGQD